MANVKDLSGQKFGRLTVIKIAGKDKQGQYKWLCKCDCENFKEIRGQHLREGKVKSCGCLKRKHGMSKSLELHSWYAMKDRCLNKNNKGYKYYGGRGIKVCERWKQFENFYTDMGDMPQGLTLDRIDNSKGYSKENCRWATWTQQMRNRRNNKMITYQGQTLCMSEWAERLNVRYDMFRGRIRHGWSLERLFSDILI